MEYSEQEIRLMGKVPPDAWQVITKDIQGTQYGDFLSLTEALAEFAELWQGEDIYESIEIAPIWNEVFHEEEK